MASTTTVHVATASILDLYEHFAKERERVLALQGVRDAKALAVQQDEAHEQEDAAAHVALVARLEAELANAHAHRAQQHTLYTAELAKHTAELEAADKALTQVLYDQEPQIQQLMGLPVQDEDDADSASGEAVDEKVGFTNYCTGGGHTFAMWPATKVFDCVRCNAKAVPVKSFTQDGEGRYKQPCSECAGAAPAPAPVPAPVPAPAPAPAPALRKCRLCNASKPPTEFPTNGFHPPNKHGVRNQKYLATCKACCAK